MVIRSSMAGLKSRITKPGLAGAWTAFWGRGGVLRRLDNGSRQRESSRQHDCGNVTLPHLIPPESDIRGANTLNWPITPQAKNYICSWCGGTGDDACASPINQS